jgi:queuine tRNA-ribosyltransferase
MRLKSAEFANDMRPIDANCTCLACKQYTRAYLNSVVTHEAIGCHLVTLHNMHYMKRLMRELRTSIVVRFLSFISTTRTLFD